MSRVRTGMLILVLTAAGASPVFADATAFIGANMTPENRAVRGFAAGIGLLLVAFEFEYAKTPDAPSAVAPSLLTGTGNVLLQTPFPVFGFQPYATTGAGLYREELGAHRETGIAFSSGLGVKVSLIGPLRLRVDYRVFKLGRGALHSPAHRVYAGVNLKF